MKNLADILTWKQNFGLLPIHLSPNVDANFVMLNGGYGDFCLQISESICEEFDYYSKSWSSNTKNFVVVEQNNNKIKLFNWTRQKIEPEEISIVKVTENFGKFYDYLLKRNHKSDRDVVPHIINLFSQFRNITLEATNPVEALNLLFVLLTSLEDDYDSLDQFKWGINNFVVPEGFDHFIEIFNAGIGSIKPELDLIIRHAAGVLFQEAQKEVLFFQPQRDLFGGVSSVIGTKKALYSSIHYTPPYLSRTIVENALRQIDLKKPTLKIFDPACGSSEFLMEALKQLKELNYSGNIQLIGWDTSETAINTSVFLLQYEKRTVWKSQLNYKVELVEDSLCKTWDNDYDLILMNPPYVSWELLGSKNHRDAVKEVLGNNFIGKPNQASAFFFKSVLSLVDGGVIGCVLPSSLLTLDSYKKLRTDIEDILSIKLIGKLGNFVFEDALTDVSIIIGHKTNKSDIPLILWTKNEKHVAQSALRDLRKMYYGNDIISSDKDYSVFHPAKFPIITDTWKLVSIDENNLLRRIERFLSEGKLVRVEEIFNVQQGIRTGNNSFFKITEQEFLNLPEEEKIYFRPVADNDSIKNGHLEISNYVWYPYGNDGLILKTEDEFIDKAEAFYNKIILYKDILSTRARKSDQTWWQLSEHRAWLRSNKPRLISSEFGRSDSFAFDARGVFAVERGNAWLPTVKYEKEFNNVEYYYLYLAIFSSPFFDQLLSIYSKQLAGGNWYDLGKKYTSKIPIPKIYKGNSVSDDINILHVESPIFVKLVEYGKSLSKGELISKESLDILVKRYIYPEI